VARFLLIPHAPEGTLAHVAACSAVAGALRERGHEPIFAYGGTRPELLERAGFEWHPVVEAGGPMYWQWFESEDELERMVSSHLELIERVQPAACITSSGFGGITAEIKGLPELALVHGLPGSAYGRPALRAWMLRDAARHPTRLVGHLRSRRFRPGARERVAAAIAEVRRLHTLPSLDSGGLAGRADVVACTTAPFLDPARELPAKWQYVGPLDYGVAGESAAEPRTGDRPRVYVTQGSTGSPALLRRAVSELADDGWQVVVSAGGLCDPRELGDLGPEVIARAIVDTRSELETADAAVIAGGAMTAMQALRAGTPTVVVPATGQQAAGALRVQRLGTGVALWPFAPRGAIGKAAKKILRDQAYAARARELAGRIRVEWDGNARSASAAERLVGARVSQ